MKVALTTWEGRISPVLDTARCAVVADIEEGRTVSQHVETFSDDSPHEKLERLRALGVDTLVCGAVSRSLADLVSSCGIQLIPFVSGELNEVLEVVAAGRIPERSFSMPGCGCQRQGFGRTVHGCGCKGGFGQGRAGRGRNRRQGMPGQ